VSILFARNRRWQRLRPGLMDQDKPGQIYFVLTPVFAILSVSVG